MKAAFPFIKSVGSPQATMLAVLGGAVAVAWLTSRLGLVIPGLLIALPLGGFGVAWLFQTPRVGVVAFIVFCFVVMTINRHLSGVPFGLGMDAILLITWVAALFHQSREVVDWSRLNNDLCKLGLVWGIVNLLEVVNPAGASLTGWFYEMRSAMLYWVLGVPLVFLLFYRRQDLDLFLKLVLAFSLAGALYGIKQKVLGPDAAEQRWLDQGAAKTHVLFGVLRIFSYYSEAAQFGASQAHITVVCVALAAGPFRWWKRVVFLLIGAATLYGMSISGTRGALFVLLGGLVMYLILSKNVRALVLGGLIVGGAFGLLKFTTVGNSNPTIVRMRTALDPNDASFQVRLRNQAKLREYLAEHPLGGGLGSIGMWGDKYNSGTYLASIPPDSYYVKVWAMYGIVGFLLWFGIMLYILGKCCGIVWRIRDPILRQKLLALTAGYAGILLASYGNEVINQMPSGMIIYFGWVFVFLGPRLDRAPAPPLAAPAVAA